MARKTKLQYKPQYMPMASNVVVRRMDNNEIINVQSSLGDRELYKLLFSSKARRKREWALIGGKY